MTPKEKAFSYVAPPDMRVDEWCCNNLRFDEPDNHGAFTLAGTEYNRQPLLDFADPTVSDIVLIYASQSRKTGLLMGAACWGMAEVGVRLLWAMPNTLLAGKFSRTRLMPMIRSSAVMAGMVDSADTYDFKVHEYKLGKSIVDFTGSNSPANLASSPCQWTFQDETDKFDEGRKEADASNLIDQRTKGQSNVKRAKTSTPTFEEGLIWSAGQKTNMQRRFVPCPHCQKFVVLSWSKTATVFPITGDEAFMQWDQEARLEDESWDLDRVERSAHHECPHCGGHILDKHKEQMDKGGEWRATRKASSRFRGYHLPSMYSPAAECRFGKLAVKFLQSKRSFQGLQGFINGDLAEPWESQDSRAQSVGNIITKRHKRTEEESAELVLTVDVQQTVPHFYYVIREWLPSGDSTRIQFGHFDKYSEIAECQMDHGIKNVRVALDCGDQESKESQYESDVYAECLKRGIVHKRKHIGWIPMRGMRASWRHRDKNGQETIVGLTKNPALIGRTLLHSLLFCGDQCLDIWDALVQGKESADGRKWDLLQQDNERDYEKHMSGKVKGRRDASGRTWHPRSHRAPAHWLDCEKMQVGLALFVGWLQWGIVEEE